MKTEDQKYVTFENLGSSERVARIIVSILAIVFAMGSSIAGTSLFSLVSVVAIALTMTGIIGWDPVRALSRKKFGKNFHVINHHNHSA